VKARVVEEGAQVGAVNEFHGKEKAVILGGFQVSAIDDVATVNLAQRANLAQEAAGEGLVAAQFRREKLEGARLVHVNVLG
jgi:hypothetical protein